MNTAERRVTVTIRRVDVFTMEMGEAEARALVSRSKREDGDLELNGVLANDPRVVPQGRAVTAKIARP